jgi:transcriptional regulator with XRE-family HTH domain
MHASEISALESGKREPGLVVQRRLSSALGMTLGELMLLTDQEEAAALRLPPKEDCHAPQ